MGSCLYQISKLYNSFSYSEKLLADYIVANQQEIVHQPIASLAASVGIAPSTIVSTVRKLGFGGYRDFKIALAMELTNSIASDWLSLSEEGSAEQDILTQVINSNIEVLKLIQQNLSRNNLEKAVDMICTAEHIYLLGEGTAGVIAMEAYDFMTRSGFRCFHEEDWQRKSLIASQATEHDLAILITTTGINANILSLTKRFQERNCPILGICNYKNTAFTKYVTLLLAPFDDLLTVHDNNFTLRVPIITILETLYYMIAQRQQERHAQVLNKNKLLTRAESIVNMGTEIRE